MTASTGPITADTERTALKEWSVLVDAMARGEIWAMIRKGGIREHRSGFTVRHERFLLYPTRFHQRESELAPRFRARLPAGDAAPADTGTITLRLLADVAATWRVDALESLRAIDDAHGLDWSAVASRFAYRHPGVHVVAVRARRLTIPVDIAERRRYGGCVSWVELDDDIDVARSEPVAPEPLLEARIAALTRALGDPRPG